MKDDIGFPQLDPSSYPSQIFWLGVAFVVLYVLMSKIALPRLGEVFENRDAQKNGNLDKASQLKEQADMVKEAYEESLSKAHQNASEALSAAEQKVSDKIATSQAAFAEEARERIAKAEANIAKAKEEALSSVMDISAELAAEMVHKIAGIKVNNDAAKKAVASVAKKG